MGKIYSHLPVKLFCGLIFKDEGLLDKTEALLERRFGKIDFRSQILPFEYTDYYQKEF
ncbi:MAG: DUF4416 family protein, partial [Candidatus Omnitrophica bacterium]|nr:DUF4416 family protein [Candidatus Omnitrophota bacterium]